MIIALLFEVFIKAFLLLILLYIVAREEADFDFRKVTMITAGIVLGAVILDAVLTRFIGLFTLIPIAAFIVFMVMQFCWVRFWRSLLVAIPFLVLNIMISTSVASFQKKADAAVARGLRGPISEEDMKVALSFYQDGGRTNKFLLPMQGKMPEIQETSDQMLVKKIVEWVTLKKSPFNPAVAVKIKEQTGEGLKTPPIDQKKDEPEHEAAPEAAPLQDWREAEKKISLKGILIGKDNVRVAIVNNQMVREGEYVQVEHKKMIYRWRASGIREKSVSWEPVETFPR